MSKDPEETKNAFFEKQRLLKSNHQTDHGVIMTTLQYTRKNATNNTNSIPIYFDTKDSKESEENKTQISIDQLIPEKKKETVGKIKSGMNIQGFCNNNECLTGSTKQPVWINFIINKYNPMIKIHLNNETI